MSAESSRPQEKLAQVSADLYMGVEDQMRLRDEITSAARELMLNQTPSNFKAELSDIPLRGEVPLSFLSTFSDGYNRLNFSAEKTDAVGSDASVTMWLLGTEHRAAQLRLHTEKVPAIFGWNKQFLLVPYGAKQSVGHISCGDLGLVLDDIIPDTGRFSALSDPRLDTSFDRIALTMGDLLRPLAPKQKTSRTYIEKDISFSVIENESYFREIGNRLIIEEAVDPNNKKTPDKTLLTLTSTVGVELDGANILEHFKYSFAPDSTKAMASVARLTLASAGVSHDVLNSYLKSTQRGISAVGIGERALAALTQNLRTS
jgi:hypothetical protein